MNKKPPRHDRTANPREATLRAREDAATARERAASSRETELVDREEQARLREDALRARAEADEIRGEREQLLAQMRDANERLVVATMQADRQAEAAAYNEERFRSLVAASAALVWHADANGQVGVDSDSWKSVTGTSTGRDSDPAWQWLESVHPEDRARARDAWKHALATKTAYQSQHRL